MSRIASLALCFLLFLGAPLGAQEPCTPDIPARSFNLVAVGLCGSRVILATPIDGSRWRSRALQLPPGGPRITQVDLARTGSSLAVYYGETGETAVLDLSGPTDSLLQRTHRVSRQTYEFSAAAGKIYRDEFGRETGERTLTRRAEPPQALLQSRDALAAPGSCQWSTYEIEPESAIYAPILEFASAETVFPSATSIWSLLQPGQQTQPAWEGAAKELRPSGFSAAERATFATYINLSNQGGGPGATGDVLGKPTVYYKTLSCAGSWLYQYWTYYPFDTGRHAHLHDTEHVFIEADKLGGGIIGVSASGHSNLVPNNLYSALRPGAEPAALPVAVIVENQKHALAPDINRDSKFTPSLDVNSTTELAQVSGIRDYDGRTDVHLFRYQDSMTLDRDFSKAWAPETFGDTYGQTQFSRLTPFGQIRRSYQLVPFPEMATTGAARLANCMRTMTQQCAEFVLNEQQDAKRPTTIYKPWAFPSQQVRVGVASIEHGAVLMFGYVTDFKHLPFPMGPLAAMPGRMVIQAGVGRARTGAPVVAGTRTYLGLEYEKYVTNFFGGYIGYLARKDFHGSSALPAGVHASNDIVHLGMYTNFSRLSIRLPRNVNIHYGVVFAKQQGARGEFRLEFDLWSKRDRTHFGYPFK